MQDIVTDNLSVSPFLVYMQVTLGLCMMLFGIIVGLLLIGALSYYLVNQHAQQQ